MSKLTMGHLSATTFRVRYSETDRMNTIYNSRVLEWFEVGRTEYLREIGTPYPEMERRGMLLPVIEAHVEYAGRATYDDLLLMETMAAHPSPLRMRFDVGISHVDGGQPVARGHTVHALTDSSGRPARPTEWFSQAIEEATGD
jgi:acyl-CoA thioester hydrolase